MYKVLVVDKDRLTRQAMSIMIEKVEGFEVCEEVSSGEKAIEVCRNESVDLVFMDVIMPDMSGVQASSVIKGIDKDISIYAFSQSENVSLTKKMFKVGARDYLIKPIFFKSIQSILNDFKIDNPRTKWDKYGELLKCIENRDLEEAYNKIPDISDDILMHIGVGNKSEKELNEISKAVLKINRCTDYDKNKIEDFIEEALHGQYRTLEFLLFYLIDSCYKSNAIKSYPILNDILTYIEDNINKNISLKSVVKDCGISQGYLSRIFKKTFNITVVNYIHLKKMMIAKELLAYRELNISGVAFQLSYNESSYFCKVFKKYNKKTVEQYKLGLIKNVKGV